VVEPPTNSAHVCLSVGAVQVPDVLFAVCCSVVQHSGVQGVTAAAITAFTALHDFLHIGTVKGGFLSGTDDSKGLDPNTSHSTNSSSSALSLVPGMRSQVLQSGLMGAVAAAMAAATEKLLCFSPYQLPAVGSSTEGAATPGAGHPDHGLVQTHCLHLTRLLWSWHWLSQLWPAGRQQVAAIAIVAPAAVQLSVAIMQVVSRDLPAAVNVVAAAPPPPPPPPGSRGSVDQAGPPGAVDSAMSYADQLCSAASAVQATLSWLGY